MHRAVSTGIATLLLSVPVSLGVLHQGVAVAIFAIWIAWLHRVRSAAPRPRPAVRVMAPPQARVRVLQGR